jgi:ParB-like chromosome segregation protein Spo0J
MQIRDRIKELRRVKAALLRPNPRNWRAHGQAQRDALCGVLAEIGYADALLARELPDGTLELIDGHLRAETTPDAEVPVLVLDLDDVEAAKLLAVHDPLAAMAETNEELLADLLAHVQTENGAVQALLDDLLEQEPNAADGEKDTAAEPPAVKIPEAFQVVIECPDEDQQRTVFQRMTAEGFKCKLLTL